MNEHQILFNGDMVRAILEGRKTQTRRPIAVPWKGGKRVPPYEPYYIEEDGKLFFENEYGDFIPMERVCPYGQPGDLLWVRETWSWGRPVGYALPQYFYRATDGDKIGRDERLDGWHPSIHMPREASRIGLRVKSVRIERVQDITETDAHEEGIDAMQYVGTRFIADLPWKYRWVALWDSTYAKRGCCWAANPWVWVIEFERVEPNK